MEKTFLEYVVAYRKLAATRNVVLSSCSIVILVRSLLRRLLMFIRPRCAVCQLLGIINFLDQYGNKDAPHLQA